MSEAPDRTDAEEEFVELVRATKICLDVDPLECPEMSPKPDSYTCDGKDGKALQLRDGSTVVATLFVPGNAAKPGTKFTLSMPPNCRRAFVQVTASPENAVLTAPLTLSIRYDWGEQMSDSDKESLGFYVAKISGGVAEPDYPCGGMREKNVVTTTLYHLSGFILAQGKKP